MSALVKLSSKLPGETEINGVDDLAEILVRDPDQIIVCLTWYAVPKITRDTQAKTEVPTIEVRRIEPIDVVARVPAAVQKLAAELYEKRTGGRQPLPFDVVEIEDGGGYVVPSSDDQADGDEGEN